ncbi:CAP domain-containing protein [Anabaena sp. UHCC 0399]|uniref:CAP domain-containing protein n=1 Tax=Anabaena sp. UHCC 0399 TaxID=3110238 RepID=UPI002B1FC544|nr:CAP domain-containing protein [Anabaena sp. UHCC 0399]MEA5567554.1 CAP domain-containing protein [Anabaena sp. UHCC 0399]
MLRTTIYSLALGSFVLASGASAVSLQTQSVNQSVQPNSSTINYDLAQYFPGQYNRRPRTFNRPVQSFPQRPYNPGQSNPGSFGGQSNPGSSGEQSNPGSSSGQSNPGSSSGQSNPGSSGGQSNSNAASIEQSVFDQINQYRASLNLPALTRNSAIDEQARGHSQNMASGQVPFSHQGAEQRFKASGVAYKSANENVAYNQDRDPATSAVQSWLKSSGHLANIKSNTNVTGIGVAVNGRGVVYLTQIFMRA